MLWQVLVQFVFRLAFGLTAAMSLTSAREVTSGFFRVHLWVGLGLNTFIAVILWLVPERFPHAGALVGCSITAAILSYVGAVTWLYERVGAGRVILVAVTLVNLAGSWLAESRIALPTVATATASGLLLGTTVSSMLLGHWYLNTPTMKMAPLRKLIRLIFFCVLLRVALVCVGLLASGAMTVEWDSTAWALFALRLLAGLVGVAILAEMAWQTLKIPNTQSATGILYVAVIFAFLGELTSQLLSVQTPYPV